MLLIIPAERKINWSSPPIITLALILINILVFVLFQQDDEKKLNDALSFYVSSPLAKLEIPLYENMSPATDKETINFRNKNQLINIAVNMIFDEKWNKKLAQGLFKKNSPDYEIWQENRQLFEERLSRVNFIRYGLTPANFSLLTAITYQFLHGDFWHLFGNMIFLLIFGFSLEKIFGALKYIVIYLLSGLGAASFFTLVNPQSYIPLIGASGAIAGLMGSYATIYGLKKIQFFIWFFAYFKYIKLPALVVLPVWIIKEVWENASAENTGIAYMAHVGGLITGALLTFILSHQFFSKAISIDTDYLEGSDEEDDRDPVTEKLEKSLQLIKNLNFKKARLELLNILKIQPGNIRALELLFNIDKLNPETKTFKKLVDHIFQVTKSERDLDEWVYQLYIKFRQLNPSGGLSLTRLIDLCQRFIRSGHTAEAVKIINLIEGARPETAQLPELILSIASAYLKSGQKYKARDWLIKIETEYKHTDQFKHASHLLDRIDNNQDI